MIITMHCFKKKQLRRLDTCFLKLSKLSDRELCHSTSKLIGDEEDTLKSFMVFDITPHGPAFRVVVDSEIVVPPTIPPSQ